MAAALALPWSTRPTSLPRLSARKAVPLLLFAAAFALRWPHFGDPAYEVDEQFYLLVGDRMLHGAIPYVDVWDRKPIGLFLIYATVRLLGGTGLVQYQLVATLFAGATAVTIARLARPSAGGWGAAAAGIVYLVWIETVRGGGGQAPVFYNLLVALAAERTLAAADAADDRRFRRHGRIAMLLVGLALQIKYTVLCEGLFFGAALAWWSVRRLAPARALTHGAALVLLALAPTLLALVAYLAMGHGQAFWYANFVSVFQRGALAPGAARSHLIEVGRQFPPFLLGALASLWEQRGDAGPWWRRSWFVLGWTIAAVAGFASVGAFFVHYALPLIVPATILAAPIFRRRPIGRVMAALLVLMPLSQLGYPGLAARREHQQAVAALTASIRADVDRRCLQLFGGPPILYLTTHACLASRFAFPNHLDSPVEAHAIGADPAAEIDRIFARRPGAVVIGADGYSTDPAMDRLIRRRLAMDYRLATTTPVDGQSIEVFVPRQDRTCLSSRACPASPGARPSAP